MSPVPRPARRCTHPGCTNDQVPGTSRCTHHKPTAWARQPHTTEQRRRRYGHAYRKQRERVLRRDEHMCVVCGTAYQLEVHHLRDADEVADEELVTLCRSHHRAAERGHEGVVAVLRAQGWLA